VIRKEASDTRGEAARAGVVQPGEEKVQGDLTHVSKYLMGEVKKMEPACSQWCSVTGQETIGRN